MNEERFSPSEEPNFWLKNCEHHAGSSKGKRMKRQTKEAIQTAIGECLAKCRQMTSPLGGLMEYIVKLRTENWYVEDIRIVETAVVKILVQLTNVKDGETGEGGHIAEPTHE